MLDARTKIAGLIVHTQASEASSGRDRGDEPTPSHRTHPGESTIFTNFSGLGLWIFCDGDLDVSTLLELHVIAVFIGQRIFET
jgi:hypothetical protein